ncbi:hypothetical protein PHMEG_00028897 [Phytophthora megakarya]|uniref:Reverse transcriptase Ty1/copia-type domain-containing protein n=1 Tax=Phytophthora megakarya TaxID=4795 RepID=A0A225V3X9_9STRA|nr:hypothetical protein PHMEG_00028897 [Phytophthora megakarya]
MIYVDDVIRATNYENFKVTFFSDLNKKYGIKDLGLIHEYLGVEAVMNKQGVLVQQKKYCGHVHERFRMADAYGCRSPMETNICIDPTKDDGDDGPQLAYRYAVGGLMCLVTKADNEIVRDGEAPNGYLVMAIGKGIFYKRPDSTQTRLTLNGYCDNGWGNCPQTRKGGTGYTIMLAGGTISWAATRQSVAAQSTAEAEYVAFCEATMDGKGSFNNLWELFPKYPTKFHLGIDNKTALAFATNPTYNRKTRHIELRWYFVREEAEKKELSIFLRLQALKIPPTYYRRVCGSVKSRLSVR